MVDTGIIDAKLNEIDYKIYDLHKRISLFETMYKEDIEDFLDELKENNLQNKNVISKEGDLNERKTKSKQRIEEE